MSILRSIPEAFAGALLAVLVLAPSLFAQSGIRWPDPQAEPSLTVLRVGLTDYQLCFSGWSTYAPAGALSADGSGTAVGLPPQARTVTSSSAKFVDDGSGTEALSPLFPFVNNPAVEPIFRPADRNLDWYGYSAAGGAVVPQRMPGTLCFRVQTSVAFPVSVMAGLLQGTKIGVARIDAAGNLLGNRQVRDVSAIAPATLFDYRFGRGSGAFAINYAPRTGGVPPIADMVGVGGGAWEPQGRFGGALRGATGYCDTGWSGGLHGSLTLACFLRERNVPAGPSNLCGAGSFGLFTGGAAGTGLRLEGWGGSPLTLNTDVQALARGAWVHVAVVIDELTSMATWYVDGAAVQSTPVSSVVALGNGATTLRIGMRSGVAGLGDYDLDDFRLRNDVVSATELAAWATSSPARSIGFGVACGGALRNLGGEPELGNANHQFRVEGPPGASVALTLGLETQLGGVDLPFDLGLLWPSLAGCPWHSSLLITIPATIPPSGVAGIAFPIRNDPAWGALEVYAQALVLDPQLELSATNPLVLSID